jgi:Tfp pilus assembly protein PilF
VKPAPSAGSAVVASVLRDAAPGAPAAAPVRVSPAAEPPPVPADVRAGYEALRRGDIATARARYEAAVAADPASVDGHLGMATAAAGNGERATAARHYRRVLELDAGNAAALAGLAALQDFTRAEGLEAKLHGDIAQNPRSAALHLTLGSLYASQLRWTEAQAAFFEAYRLDPGSADIAYNLAVSLDHLGQRRLASDFYGRALAAARDRGTPFDKGEVARRMAELKP